MQWLDLSFNKIRKISGLESLPALRDVSLYSNKITAVEGLDGCPQLEVLSLGNNRVAATEQLLRLRRIGSLKSLSIAGNPVVRVICHVCVCAPLTPSLLHVPSRPTNTNTH